MRCPAIPAQVDSAHYIGSSTVHYPYYIISRVPFRNSPSSRISAKFTGATRNISFWLSQMYVDSGRVIERLAVDSYAPRCPRGVGAACHTWCEPRVESPFCSLVWVLHQLPQHVIHASLKLDILLILYKFSTYKWLLYKVWLLNWSSFRFCLFHVPSPRVFRSS